MSAVPNRAVSSEGSDLSSISSQDVGIEDDSHGNSSNAHLIHAKGQQSTSKKRKIYGDRIFETRQKRLKPFYNDKYRRLLNESVKGVSESYERAKYPLQSSQMGAVMWSPLEKNCFFQALARKGRHDLPGIAAIIGTKTEIEVHDYLQLLHENLIIEHLSGRRPGVFGTPEIPSAVEVSSDCCTQLEQAGDALAAMQQVTDMELEKKKNPDNWLLTPRIGRQVHLRLRRKGDEGERELLQTIPAAVNLNLNVFLQLSSQIFMNSQDSDKNWRQYAEGVERPSIFHTAFEDFHRLMVSVTKRLISTSIFCAMSRLRAVTSSDRQLEQVVRRQDVRAAQKVLNLYSKSKTDWTEVAKRCKVEIVEDTQLQEPSIPDVDQSDKEDSVSLSLPASRASSHSFGSEDDSDAPSVSSSSPNKSESGSSEQQPEPNNSNNESNPLQPQSPLQDPQDTYLESIDANASLREELRLWELLDKPAPEALSSQKISIPKAPDTYRKSRDDLGDWMTWVDDKEEWEVFGSMGEKEDRE